MIDFLDGLPLPPRRAGGDDEPGVPKHQGSVSLSLTRWEPLSVVLSTHYVGARDTQGDLGRGFDRFSESSFMTTDFALAYRFGERFSVFSRVENVLDSQHGEGLGSQSPGRAVYFGVATKY